MGQAESKKPAAMDATDRAKTWHSSIRSPLVARQDYQRSSASMNSLSAEAAAHGDDENKSLEDLAKKALECPCIEDLRNGPCGSQFSAAFLCFLTSNSEEQGSDCVYQFVALQNCIKNNPNAFKEEEVKKGGGPTQDYRILAPSWSKESESPKPRL